MDDEPRKQRPSISQLSKTPSWVMLGFILGVLFVLALPRKEPVPAPRPIVAASEAPPPARAAEPPQLTTIEAVFGEWATYAVWDHDVTQVAMWNASVGDFAEFYEVRRYDDVYYFRSIPQLSHRIVRHGRQPPRECPLLFTETDAQYQEWREQGRFERPPEDVRPPAFPKPASAPKPTMEDSSIAPPPVEHKIDTPPRDG